MNLGYTTGSEYLPENTEMDFFINWSYQINDFTWVYQIGNPTDDNLVMKIVYSCIGESDPSK